MSVVMSNSLLSVTTYMEVSKLDKSSPFWLLFTLNIRLYCSNILFHFYVNSCCAILFSICILVRLKTKAVKHVVSDDEEKHVSIALKLIPFRQMVVHIFQTTNLDWMCR